MRTNIFILCILAFAMAAIVEGCNSPAEKVEKATEELEDAKEELIIDKKDSVADFEAFKRESDERIAANDRVIAAFKARMVTDKKHVKANDQKVIDDLEQRNINMRKKIEEYKENGNNGWEEFKTEFNHDMDQLGTALKGLTINDRQ